MHTYYQIEKMAETLSTMEQTFKIHVQDIQRQLETLEALIEQLERRLRNLRNEG